MPHPWRPPPNGPPQKSISSSAQLITDSAHSSGNTLDVLLCNTRSSELINTFCVSSPFSVSCDHFSLEMSMNFSIKKTKEKVSPRPNFKKADYGTICSYLQCVDWNNIIACHGCDIQSLYDCFLNILSDSIELFVPKFTTKKQKKKALTHQAIIERKTKLLSTS